MITAGVYVKLEGRFAFMLGPNKDRTAHGVVRFGGHAEGNETAVECAMREVREEASIDVMLSRPAAMFYMADMDALPEVVATADTRDPWPLLLSGGSPSSPNSVTFIGTATSAPRPSAETQGIALLTGAEVRRICAGSITLGELIDSGGRVIERTELDRRLRLVPHLQLKFLSWALEHGVVDE